METITWLQVDSIVRRHDAWDERATECQKPAETLPNSFLLKTSSVPASTTSQSGSGSPQLLANSTRASILTEAYEKLGAM